MALLPVSPVTFPLLSLLAVVGTPYLVSPTLLLQAGPWVFNPLQVPFGALPNSQCSVRSVN